MRYIVCRFQRAKPIIIDPGLYMLKKADVFWIPQRRSVPTAFKLFTGMVERAFVFASFPLRSNGIICFTIAWL